MVEDKPGRPASSKIRPHRGQQRWWSWEGKSAVLPPFVSLFEWAGVRERKGRRNAYAGLIEFNDSSVSALPWWTLQFSRSGSHLGRPWNRLCRAMCVCSVRSVCYRIGVNDFDGGSKSGSRDTSYTQWFNAPSKDCVRCVNCVYPNWIQIKPRPMAKLNGMFSWLASSVMCLRVIRMQINVFGGSIKVILMLMDAAVPLLKRWKHTLRAVLKSKPDPSSVG